MDVEPVLRVAKAGVWQRMCDFGLWMWVSDGGWVSMKLVLLCKCCLLTNDSMVRVSANDMRQFAASSICDFPSHLPGTPMGLALLRMHLWLGMEKIDFCRCRDTVQVIMVHEKTLPLADMSDDADLSVFFPGCKMDKNMMRLG